MDINDLISKNNINVSYLYKYDDILNFIKSLKGKTIACDIETPHFDFYIEGAKVLSIGFAESEKDVTVCSFVNMSKDDITYIIKEYNKNVEFSIFHNYYFDRSYTKGVYGEGLVCHYDTFLGCHTALIERKLQGKGFSLKDLARDFTTFGDYEVGLEEFKTNYCKENNIKKSDFTYDLVPEGILLPYNAIDCITTMILYNKLKIYTEKLKNIKNWKNVEEMIKLKFDVTEEYINAKLNGINIDKEEIYKLDEQFKIKRSEYQYALENSPDIESAKKLILKTKLKKEIEKLKQEIEELKNYPSEDSRYLKKLNTRELKLSKLKSKDYFNELLQDVEFNFSSPNHKRILYYDILGIEQKYFTKTKNLATGKIIVDRYADKYDILNVFKNYGLYNKGITAFLGTDLIENEIDSEEDYLDSEDDDLLLEEKEEVASSKNSLLACISKDNKVYPSINIGGTTTSRLSMTRINLAQYPARGVLYDLRKCIVPEKGHTFLSFDFSNLEVRLVAILSNEEGLLKAFKEGLDLHSITAIKIFKDKMRDIDYTKSLKEQCKEVKDKYGETYRQFSKAVLFGTIYGITGKGLSKNLNVSIEEADEMIEGFFKGYPNLKKYIDETINKACTLGYVENLHGLRLHTPACLGYVPNSKSKNKNYDAIRQIKQAVNFTVQSSNSTLLYKSILTFMNEVRELKLDVKMLFTIYDALYISYNHITVNAEDLKLLMKKHFESNINGLDILIDICEYEEGKSWYHTK